MPTYLANEDIRRAVDNLGESSARARMCEFLIGVRTLTLAGADEIAIAESTPEFIQALEEFTLWAPPDNTADSPYFNPFGSQAGFKSRKFRSNGPSNTIHGWATQADSPFEIINTRPKSIKRRLLSPTQLRTFFLIRSRKEAERPRLLDAAVWFYRSVDLEGADGAAPDRAALEGKFVDEVGLNDADIAALFRLEEEDTDADTTGSESPETPVMDMDSDNGPEPAA